MLNPNTTTETAPLSTIEQLESVLFNLRAASADAGRLADAQPDDDLAFDIGVELHAINRHIAAIEGLLAQAAAKAAPLPANITRI